MADKPSDGLPYGQFGAAIYDADESEWKFGRTPGSCTCVQPVESPNTIAKQPAAKAHGSRPWSDSKGMPSRRREKQTKALVQSNPELQPAAGLLPEFARVSEAVEEAVFQHDSSTGQLVTLGKVYDESRRDYVDAIAFSHGPTGSDLRIVQGLKQRRGWNEDRSSSIETLSFTGEKAILKGSGAPILSIIFAQPLESGEHYLGVRLHTETLVLRPVLRKHAIPCCSRLDPNLLFSINIDETGGLPHAHVAFNPWFTGQLAVVDHAGSWSVWETGRKSRHSKKVKSGTVAVETPRNEDRSLDDGWARVTWVEGTSTLCIATRRELVFVDLEAADEIAPTTVDVGLKQGLRWILDVGTPQTRLDHLFVLTSNHISIYSIGKAPDRQIASGAIIQIRHHRNPEDVSLRMTLGASEDGTLLVLRSAFSPAVNQFRFDISDPEQVRIQQPQSFDLPPTLSALKISDCQLQAVSFIKSKDETLVGSDLSRFWHLYLLCKDFALSQTLYGSRISQRRPGLVEAPTWAKEVSKPPKNLRATLAGLVDDGEKESCRPPMSNFVQRRQRQSLSRSGDEWTISYERLARNLNESNLADQVDIDEVIDEVSALLQRALSAPPVPMRTFWEVAGGGVAVEDVDGASERLAGLCMTQVESVAVKKEDGEPSQESRAEWLGVFPIADSAAMDLLGLGELSTLSGAINALRQTWTAPAEGSLAAATNAARDEHTRRMAADVVLASQVMRTVSGEPDNTSAMQSQSQAWDIPVRPTPSGDRSQGAKSDISQRSQSLALPTPSASVSTVTGSSYPLGSAAPEVTRLSKYTAFSEDAPPTLPRALNTVLTHWTVGADPAEYDWRSTARQVSRRDEAAEEDDMTEKERRQMQRRTERYMRRQRREAEESQRMQMLSSQAPEIASASQPAQRQGLRRAESQASAGAPNVSSQSYELSQTAASQVVPGRHGGRPPKKKRKSGF